MAGSLLCAGITMFDPIRYWGFTKKTGKTIGIIGIGGLGTMGIKLGKALGHRVVAISRTMDKEAAAIEKGADAYVASSDKDSMAKETKKIDLILNTISANHDLTHYIPLLRRNGVIVQLGACLAPHPVSQLPLMFGRVSITGNAAGGTESTKEMIELCTSKKIMPDI
jgi:D-arabinose 1-dehydrogenase-like Zn-dependent alcohol dehydrogenase